MSQLTATKASIDLNRMQRLAYTALLAVGMSVLLSNPVLADVAVTASTPVGPVTPGGSAGVASSPMGAVLCRVVGIILGDAGRGLATLAVIIVGIGATLGKVSWGMAMTVAVGIAVVFGAPSLVATIGVQGGGCSGGSMIMAGGFYAGGGGYGGGYGAANDACYSGAKGTKGTITDIKCGASAATDILGVIGGKDNADQGGIIGIFR